MVGIHPEDEPGVDVIRGGVSVAGAVRRRPAVCPSMVPELRRVSGPEAERASTPKPVAPALVPVIWKLGMARPFVPPTGA